MVSVKTTEVTINHRHSAAILLKWQAMISCVHDRWLCRVSLTVSVGMSCL